MTLSGHYLYYFHRCLAFTMSEKSPKLIVEGLTESTTVTQLTLVLGNKRRQGGGPIESIELTKDGSRRSAIVTFEDANAVDIILNRGDTVVISNVTARVKRFVDSCEEKSRFKSSDRKSKKSDTSDDELVSSCDDLSDNGAKNKTHKPLKMNSGKKDPSMVKKAHSAINKDSEPPIKMPKANLHSSDDEQIVSSDDLSENESLHEKPKYKTNKSHIEINKQANPFLIKKNNSMTAEETKHRRILKTNSQTINDEEMVSSDDLSESEILLKKLNKVQKSVIKTPPKEKRTMVNKAYTETKERSHRKNSDVNVQTTDDEQEPVPYDLSEDEMLSKSKNKELKSIKKFTKCKNEKQNKTFSSPNKKTKSQSKDSKTSTLNSDDEQEAIEDLSESEMEIPKYKRKTSLKNTTKMKSSPVSMTSSGSNEDSEEDLETPWDTTIKANVKDITESKNFYISYFQDKSISQGPFYEQSLLLDGVNRKLYVTFHTKTAAIATTRFKHKSCSNLYNVEMATEDDFNTHNNLMSVHGHYCTTLEQKQELMAKVAEQTKLQVLDIIQHDEPRSAIIVFNPETCQDISAATWASLFHNKVRLILAPVFKTNSVIVTGFNSLSSLSTLGRYLSDNSRSGGGEVKSCEQKNKREILVTFKTRESCNGVLDKSPHLVDGGELYINPYYPCLSPEFFKDCIRHHMNITGTNDRLHIDTSHNVHHSKGQVPSVAGQSSVPSLRCTVGPIYTAVNFFPSPKHAQFTLQLCKFGAVFLMRQTNSLQEIMQTNHCKHTLSPKDSFGLLSVKLDWPNKIPFKEVKFNLQNSLASLRKFLDTFRVAECNIDDSYIHEFQKFCQMRCKQEMPEIEAFFDHLNNLAFFFSNHDELWITNSVNKMYQIFVYSKSKPDAGYMGSQNFPKVNVGFVPNVGSKLNIGSKPHVASKPNIGPKPNAGPKLKQGNSERMHFPLSQNDKHNSVTDEKEDTTKVGPEQFSFAKELKLEETDIILFQKTNFHKNVEESNKPMEITLNSDEIHALIKTNEEHKIALAELALLKKSRDFASLSIRSMFEPDQLQLLSKQDVQDRINKHFTEKGYHAHFRCNQTITNLCFVKGVNETVLKDVIQSHVVTKKRSIDNDVTFILQSDKGRKFLSDLSESSDGIKVSSNINLQDTNLQIIASSPQVDILMSAVDRFVEENKLDEKQIPFSSGKQLYVKKFLEKEMTKIASSLTPLGAKIIYKSENIAVQGLKEGVSLGETLLSHLSAKILVQDVPIKYFGIKEFLNTVEGKSHLANVESIKQCVILTATNVPSEQGSTAKASRGMPTQLARHPKLIVRAKVGKCSLLFMQGDITELDADAIVNPLDSTLRFQSGLAKALILKGGLKIQTELVSSYLKGIPGEVTETSAGNLDKCKSIIHVVCPVFTGTEVDALEGAITACIEHTTTRTLKSLAIPAMGTGKKFKFPSVVACKLLMKSLYKHLTSESASLTNIFLCDVQADHVKELIVRFKNITDMDVEEVGELEESSHNAPTQAPKSLPANARPQKNFRHIKVNLVKGEITKQKTDVIVVTIGQNMDLSKGGITKDIAKFGGDTVQQELLTNHGDGIQPGKFGTTSGGNLQCKSIFYARLHHWKGNSEEHMNKIVYKMLQSADQQSDASISFPAIGTGNLGYPADVAADTITNAICQFAMDNPNSSLKSVNLVVFPKDTNVVQAFQAVLSTGGQRGADASASDSDASGRFQFWKKAKASDSSKHHSSSKHELQFKSVKLTIKKGDITAEKCDAIVSGVRDSMDLSNSGAVCKALLQKCGSALQDECNTKNDEMAQDGFVLTSAPNLNCQKIYHVSMDKFSRRWDKCISKVLTDAESQGFTSVAIPAFGTGAKNADLQGIKQTIFRGVDHFAEKNQKNLQDVRLVVFSQEILDEFLDSQKHSSRGHEAEGPSKVMINVSDHVDLKVYAETHETVVSVSKELNVAFKQAFKEEKEKDMEVKRLKQHQVQQLVDEGLKYCVQVVVSVEDGLITMKGFKAEGFMHVVKLLKTLLLTAVKDHHKSIQRSVVSVIQWQFDQQGKWRNFEPILNNELESEYQKKSTHHDITDSQNRTYRIDMRKMKEFQLNGKGQPSHPIDVRRHDRSKEGERLPKKWESMGSSENLKLVVLQSGSAEFKSAEQTFIKGGANVPVKKIERVQNKALYQLFKVKKREMEHRNPKGHKNEQTLFHGTDAASVKAINEHGFNRSYCGKNATAYGKGVYFAVNSSYSVSYATPSPQGERFMYIVRVLTGVSTPSNSTMNHLPNQPGTNIPYDSGNATGMFIIFHDAQTYPEYLITF